MKSIALIILLLSTSYNGYTQNFTKWLTLEIEHAYFAEDITLFDIIPTQRTNEILISNNIIFQHIKGGYVFYIESPSTGIDIASKIENLGILEFGMVQTDSKFFNYTEGSLLNSGEYYLFKNTSNNATLQKEKISTEELEEQMITKGIGVLQINVNDLQSEKLTLSFEARKVIYQYKIVLPNDQDLKFSNLEFFWFGQEEFSGPIEETNIDGQTVLVFTSTTAIPLMQALADLPLLKMDSIYRSFKIQVLEIRLPNPSLESLRITENGEYICVVIVYV